MIPAIATATAATMMITYGCWVRLASRRRGSILSSIPPMNSTHRNIHLRHVSAVMSADFLSLKGWDNHEGVVCAPSVERVYCK